MCGDFPMFLLHMPTELFKDNDVVGGIRISRKEGHFHVCKFYVYFRSVIHAGKMIRDWHEFLDV